jgi:hypothetical protein
VQNSFLTQNCCIVRFAYGSHLQRSGELELFLAFARVLHCILFFSIIDQIEGPAYITESVKDDEAGARPTDEINTVSNLKEYSVKLISYILT